MAYPNLGPGPGYARRTKSDVRVHRHLSVSEGPSTEQQGEAQHAIKVLPDDGLIDGGHARPCIFRQRAHSAIKARIRFCRGGPFCQPADTACREKEAVGPGCGKRAVCFLRLPREEEQGPCRIRGGVPAGRWSPLFMAQPGLADWAAGRRSMTGWPAHDTARRRDQPCIAQQWLRRT